MYKPRIIAAMLLLVIGCDAATKHTHPAGDKTVPTGGNTQQIAKFIDEKDPWTKYYNAWDFVSSEAKTATVTDCEPPGFIKMHLGKTATDWSRIEGTRRITNETQDASTLRIEITSLAYGLPWAPAKQAVTAWQSEADDQSGMLQWRWQDNSEPEKQNVEFWFRMNTRESFLAE